MIIDVRIRKISHPRRNIAWWSTGQPDGDFPASGGFPGERRPVSSDLAATDVRQPVAASGCSTMPSRRMPAHEAPRGNLDAHGQIAVRPQVARTAPVVRDRACPLPLDPPRIARQEFGPDGPVARSLDAADVPSAGATNREQSRLDRDVHSDRQTRRYRIERVNITSGMMLPNRGVSHSEASFFLCLLTARHVARRDSTWCACQPGVPTRSTAW
jgi:hypothetical protein